MSRLIAERLVKDAGALGWTEVGTGEAALIQRCAAGEQSACAELVASHERMVFQLALHLLGDRDEALDLSQEVFLRVFRTIHTFRGQSALRTWIYRIAINQARNRWRWWKRRRRDSTVSLDANDETGRQSLIATLKSDTSRDPEKDTLAHERERALRKALGDLRRVYRETVILRDIEGFAYEEIAVALEISVGTVKSRLARGRQELRRKLEGSL